jgi:DNA modification methylase
MYQNQMVGIDPRNNINDLTNQEWLKRTSSIGITPQQKEAFFNVHPHLYEIRKFLIHQFGPEALQMVFGDIVPSLMVYPYRNPDKYSLAHPASFDEREIIDHIELLTKRNEIVLDIFNGSGNTLSSCYKTGRTGGGIELMTEWIEITKKRILEVTGSPYQSGKNNLYLKQGDCREVLSTMKSDNIDLIITSPPYFNILKNTNGWRSRRRSGNGFAVNYGNSSKDLGMMDNYEEFMGQMTLIYNHCYRILKKGKFMVIIVADISSKGGFVPYHIDTIHAASSPGLKLCGIQVVMDHWKRFNGYGIPVRLSLNFHHHYALIFRK